MTNKYSIYEINDVLTKTYGNIDWMHFIKQMHFAAKTTNAQDSFIKIIDELITTTIVNTALADVRAKAAEEAEALLDDLLIGTVI